MAAAKNVGNAFGFNVHVKEDSNPEDITEAGHVVRDVIYGSNFVASHLVHFYQLAALDFLDVTSTGLPGMDKSPLCPAYIPPAGPLYNYLYRIPPAVTTYLVAQYVLALTYRRMANQIGAIWGGRAPFVQGLLPGGVATSISQAAITKTRELLFGGAGYDKDHPKPGSILAFLGQPTDFARWVTDGMPALSVADPNYGTHLFDVVAAAMFYPEYFWLGNAHERFLAYGVFEKGNLTNPIGDQRLLARGRKRSGAIYSNQTHGTLAPPSQPLAGAVHWYPAEQQNVYENIAHSYYSYSGTGIPANWRHPWNGETTPAPAKGGAYSWVKSPRYRDDSDTAFVDAGGGIRAIPYEVGPLARMMVNGSYYAGILYDLGYHAIPALGTPLDGVKIPEYNESGPNLYGVYGPFGPNLSTVSYKGDSALDRYAARQIECWVVARAIADWLDRLDGMIGNVTSKTRTFNGSKIPTAAQGYGWTEAPRGALGHWIQIENQRISRYQCVVPSTWNASPTDMLGQPGPAEKAMQGIFIADDKYPLEILRVSHSWDFCTACAVHLVKRNDKGEVEGETTIKIDPTHPM
jgi:hydrogenase large subunit